MNMKFDAKKLKDAFRNLKRSPINPEDVEHESKMIMYRFLSEIEDLMEKNSMTKKDLARLIGTSPSYITQLYRGSKLLNLPTIAKLQMVFNILFNVQAVADYRSNESFLEDDSETSKYLSKPFNSDCLPSQTLKFFRGFDFSSSVNENPMKQPAKHEVKIRRIAA